MPNVTKYHLTGKGFKAQEQFIIVYSIEYGGSKCEQIEPINNNVVIPFHVGKLKITVDHEVLPKPQDFNHNDKL